VALSELAGGCGLKTENKLLDGFALFTDGSVEPRSGMGVGAYLLVRLEEFTLEPEELKSQQFRERVKTHVFENTSSTRLEVETALWAIKEYQKILQDLDKRPFRPLQLYSDSQCVSGLLGRRNKLEANQFCSKKTKKPLRNADLYRIFYHLFDQMYFEVVKVTGHTKSRERTNIDTLFVHVDRTARRTLQGLL